MKKTIALALLSTFLIFPATASEKADPAREQIKRLQIALRKLEQEKAQIALEKSAAESKLNELAGKANDSRKQANSASARIAALKDELSAAQTEKEALAGRLAEAERKLVAMTEQQRATDAERQRLDGTREKLEAAVAEQKQSMAVCEEKNARLYAQGVDLAERYRTKTCFDATLQREPFTGLRRVEIENAIEDARDKLDEHKLEAPARAPATAAGAG